MIAPFRREGVTVCPGHTLGLTKIGDRNGQKSYIDHTSRSSSSYVLLSDYVLSTIWDSLARGEGVTQGHTVTPCYSDGNNVHRWVTP